MIAARAIGPTGADTIIVGLTEKDIDEMRKGLTKIKEGGQAWGFKSLLVFMGPSDEEMLKTLSQAGTIRRDDPKQKGMG